MTEIKYLFVFLIKVEFPVYSNEIPFTEELVVPQIKNVASKLYRKNAHIVW